MPITAGAKKKVRGDKAKTAVNKPVKSRMKKALKVVASTPTSETVNEAYSALDKAVKRKVITKAKAARLKSRIVKAAKSGLKTSPFKKK